MTAKLAKRLFASYSRKDTRRVHELVRLLRVSGAPVFLDTDSIPSGQKWQHEIQLALTAADAIVVFWSYAAIESIEVKREYEYAIQLGKDVVPIVLDDVPLTEILAQYQGVILSDLFVPHDVTFDPTLHIERLVIRLIETPPFL
jgi:hypothetical protein